MSRTRTNTRTYTAREKYITRSAVSDRRTDARVMRALSFGLTVRNDGSIVTRTGTVIRNVRID